jgi:hypothetical protein
VPEMPAVLQPTCLRRLVDGWRSRAQLLARYRSRMRNVVKSRSSTRDPFGRRQANAIGIPLIARRAYRLRGDVKHHMQSRVATNRITAIHMPLNVIVSISDPERSDARISLRRPGPSLRGVSRSVVGVPGPDGPMAVTRWTRIEQVHTAAPFLPHSSLGLPGHAGRAGTSGTPGQPGRAGIGIVAESMGSNWSGRAATQIPPTPAPTADDQSTFTTSPTSAPVLPTVDEITTQVIRTIERRAVAQRERLARG